MGCCVSASRNTRPSQQQECSSTTKPHESRTPPPSSIEETVKEVVLSCETISSNYQQKQEEDSKAAIVNTNPNQQSPYKISQKGIRNDTKEEIFQAISDTSTVTEGNEYNEFRQVVNRSPAKNRSFSGDMGSKRDRPVAKSASRRFEESPGRVNGVPARMVQGKRDVGESSGRQSRSPGTRVIDGSGGMNLGRTPSARRTSRSPGRVNRNPNPNPHPKESDMKVAEENDAVESLENPLVSLECFIFL